MAAAPGYGPYAHQDQGFHGSYNGHPHSVASGPTMMGHEAGRSHAGHDPQPACCGLCEPARIVEQQWTFVGEGRGSHQFVPNYIYVGAGEGAWVREERFIPNPRRSMALWATGGCLCLLATLALTLLAVSLATGRPLGLPEGSLERAHHHLRSAHEHVSGAASSLASHASGAASRAAPHVHNALRGAYHHASNAAGAARDAAAKYGPGVADKLREGAGAAYHHASDAARAAHGAVLRHGPGVYDQVKQGAGAAYHHASHAASAAHGAAANALEEAAET